jgi:hypothetical protein
MFRRDLLPPSSWQMEAVYFSKMMVPMCQTMWCHTPRRHASVSAVSLNVFIETFSECVMFIVEHVVNKMLQTSLTSSFKKIC